MFSLRFVLDMNSFNQKVPITLVEAEILFDIACFEEEKETEVFFLSFFFLRKFDSSEVEALELLFVYVALMSVLRVL